jgi:NAD(P)-dependent dehydrogenase (short-subunit alcohol dehydrogenase family)
MGVGIMGHLDGSIAIVTGGGGSGIGHGISLELARAGATVVIVEIDVAAAERVRKEISRLGGKSDVFRADISQSKDVQALVDHVVRNHCRIDLLVNNAGIGLIRPVAEATEEEFDRLMGVDLRGMWLCCKFAIPHMQRQKVGAIVNIASVHGRATLPGFGLYAAMKAGVAGLTRGIAVQYGPDGIRANTISPGLVDGQQTRDVVAQITNNVEGWLQDYVRSEQTLRWMIKPEDIGRVVAFLGSLDARSVTGVDIPVDAGTLVQLMSRR